MHARSSNHASHIQVPKDAIGILWLPLCAQVGGPKIFLLKITSANPAFCSKSDETFLQTEENWTMFTGCTNTAVIYMLPGIRS
jgi:hypothetical protein